jgi:hypothetical protein
MAEMQCFFSWLVDNFDTEVQQQISRRGWTDQQRQQDAFSWYDWWQQHDVTSSGRRWTDQQQRHDSSSLGLSTVWLVTCDGESACAGGLIGSGKKNAFSWYDWRQQHNATSSGRGWTDWWQRHDASSLGWLTVRLLTCKGESACVGGLIYGSDTMLFLGMIDGGNTMLLPLAGWGWEGTLATCLVWQTKLWCTQKKTLYKRRNK